MSEYGAEADVGKSAGGNRLRLGHTESDDIVDDKV